MNFHCPICKNLHPKERLVVVKKQSEMTLRNVITISQEGSYCVTNLGSVEKYLAEREKFANRRPNKNRWCFFVNTSPLAKK